MKIFISHSSKDRELVKKITDLLERALYIDSKEIYCTSTHNNINIGENFINNIRDNLKYAQVVFFLITENYINSYFCLMEAGASWAFKDNIIPLLVPPLKYDFLRNTPLAPVHTGMINNENDIRDIYKKLVDSSVIKRLDLEKEIELREEIKKFIVNINSCISITNEELLGSARCLAVSENGDSEALTISNKLDGTDRIILLKYNFRPNNYYQRPSSFVSYVLQFYPYRSFAHLAKDSVISFNIRSENNDISNLIVELKSGDRLVKICEKKIDICNEWKKCTIPICFDNISTDCLKEIAEICFVLKSSFAQELSGTFEISNISLESRSNN